MILMVQQFAEAACHCQRKTNCMILQAKAESAASCAIAAAGMLQSIGGTAGKAQYWRSYYGPAVPYMITVLALIIPRQPQLASKASPSPLSALKWITVKPY